MSSALTLASIEAIQRDVVSKTEAENVGFIASMPYARGNLPVQGCTARFKIGAFDPAQDGNGSFAVGNFRHTARFGYFIIKVSGRFQ